MRLTKSLATRRLGPWILVAVAALVVAAHLGLGGILLTHWGWSLGVVLAVLGAKLLAMTGLHIYRRHRARDRGRLKGSHRRPG
jgi:hypothetical protein